MAEPGGVRSGRLCPKCRLGMRPLRLGEVEVDLCPACMGMWFDARELSRAAGLKFDDSVTGAALSAGRRTQHRCPCCAVYLYEREVEKGSGIFIDQCPHCAGVFTDKGEFGSIQAFFRKAGAPVRRVEIDSNGRREGAPVTLDSESSWLVLFQYLTGLPLEVDLPQTLFPPVVTALIVANVAALIASYAFGLKETVLALGLVPADVTAGRHIYTFLTSMFLHGGIFHLIGNMYFLYVTGDNVEERLGWWQFLCFYLVAGVAADLAHVVGWPGSGIPAVGASGAISGVIGAYVVFFPSVRFQMRWFYFFWKHITFRWPVWVYFGLWVLVQALFAALGVPGVAWWAHIGGFVFGVAVALYLRSRETRLATDQGRA
jgi:membrane associated rhomboid family serine protease